MKTWSYHPSPSIDKNIYEQLSVFPREHDMTHFLLRTFWNILLRGFLKVYFRLRIIGKENLSRCRSYVLVANHSSHLDAVCLSTTIPMKKINRTFSVAAKDYFFSSLWRSLLSAIFINALPFDRNKQSRESLELCADVLNLSDHALIMFPEGTRSLTGDIQPFKPGIGILVAGTDRLVIPSYIKGAHTAWPKGSHLPRPKRVCVRIGEPLDFSHVKRTKDGFVEVARETEASVRNLAK